MNENVKTFLIMTAAVAVGVTLGNLAHTHVKFLMDKTA